MKKIELKQGLEKFIQLIITAEYAYTIRKVLKRFFDKYGDLQEVKNLIIQLEQK